MDWLWWLGAALVLAVVEILTLDLVLLMFVGGAGAGLVANSLGADVTVQVLVFAVTSTVLLFTLRPWLLRHWRTRTPLVETNAAAQVGRPATVVTEVTDRYGRVKLVGEVWTARSESPGQVFPAGTDVRVVRIEGATAVVGPPSAQPQTPPDISATSPQTDHGAGHPGTTPASGAVPSDGEQPPTTTSSA